MVCETEKAPQTGCLSKVVYSCRGQKSEGRGQLEYIPLKALGKCLFWLLLSCLPVAPRSPQMACVYLVSMCLHILLPLCFCFCAHFHYTHIACAGTQIYTHIYPFAHTYNMNHNSLGMIIFIENRFFFHSIHLDGRSSPFYPLSSPQLPLLSKSTSLLFSIRKG